MEGITIKVQTDGWLKKKTSEQSMRLTFHYDILNWMCSFHLHIDIPVNVYLLYKNLFCPYELKNICCIFAT